MFVFSKAMKSKEELYEWKAWFTSKGVYSLIEACKGGYVLLVSGEEADTSKHNCPEPSMGNCLYCGKPPPHAQDHFIFCDELCMEAMRRRLYEGD